MEGTLTVVIWILLPVLLLVALFLIDMLIKLSKYLEAKTKSESMMYLNVRGPKQ